MLEVSETATERSRDVKIARIIPKPSVWRTYNSDGDFWFLVKKIKKPPTAELKIITQRRGLGGDRALWRRD